QEKQSLANGKRTGGVLDASETITGFHCYFSSDAVLVVVGGCSQQHRGKPNLHKQYPELQTHPSAIHFSPLKGYGLGVRLRAELSDRNRVPWRLAELSSIRSGIRARIGREPVQRAG